MSTYKDKYIKYKKKYLKLKYKLKGGTNSCPACTFKNEDGTPNCEMCRTKLPEQKTVPIDILKETLKELITNLKIGQIDKGAFKFQLKNFITTNYKISVTEENILNLIKRYDTHKNIDILLIDIKNLIRTINNSENDTKRKPRARVEDIKTIKDRLPTQMTNNWNDYDEKALQNLINHKEKLIKAIHKSKVIGFNGLQYFVMKNVDFKSENFKTPFGKNYKSAANLSEAFQELGFEVTDDKDDIKILTQFHRKNSQHRIGKHGGINHEFLLAVFPNLVDKLKDVDKGTFVNREEIQKMLGK